ncbi:hypothetical protein ZIOFF_001709 [Zingiber officinale]|uniref:Uncharacterized protein n=2 Tax=Zingiber officinale TaxID=94328 RepID=A0A8J5HV79_ZINOF|nr:hypothetical protein ZIOFF_001709 [Zingiber officinale]
MPAEKRNRNPMELDLPDPSSDDKEALDTHNRLLLIMVNKRKQKLIQNIRGQELRDNDLQDKHESHDITSNSQLDTQNGALELDQNEEFTEEMLTSQRQQNRHGRTVMRDVHALDPDDVLVVQFNERGQPYGDIQPVLANFVGTIARNGKLLPLSFLDWRKMPKKCLNDAWRKVTAHFDIPDHHRDIIMQMMGAAWRRWRTEIKAKFYDPNTPLDELVSIRPVPQKLTPEVWEALCHY